MGSCDNVNTDISERLHTANLKVEYRCSNKVNYIRQILLNNEWCTGLLCMEETVTYLALEGWYEMDSANGFNLLSATYTWRSIRRAHLLHLQSLQDDPNICLIFQQVYNLRERHISKL
jgi:hypothetical protein